ncbi:sigma-54-dependent transcriptional regulator [Flavobacterium sedimenticola]|uniref:Sigma-54 dependent transcriptional regulator n=1 Tax=Flavobacterium sedimenticola TaxID=3043286 RepID=A0ABT6XNR8_9FLAO|nr:sigma-54 dependent transcriptional regulator [Flavobacterium sedimenticola]MDI9256737.1 sigma-54 dependent transcriptional regulator [Flavobacterium sedimenticola]
MKWNKENVLIVDDNYDMLELLRRHLKSLDYHTYKASSVTEAIGVLEETNIDLLITDLQMPGMNGIELLKYAEEHFPSIPKLVITGFPSVESALHAVKAGAQDYLIKPFTAEEFKKAIKQMLQKAAANPLQRANKSDAKYHPKEHHYAGMVGSSESFLKMTDVIERVKDLTATVLIQGESGTGKELIARAIHYQGNRANRPFIPVNCGAIPEHLMESELFGYVKGAFTGAHENRTGLFQAAQGGTLFLDEIGTASPAVQTRLLRVLQEKEVTMIGAQKPQKVDVRIISATNADLTTLCQKGTFREDLYYRLNVVQIETVPLRDRKADILPIAQQLLQKYGAEYNKVGVTLTDKAIEILVRYSWPGNVRELENVIQRMIILGDTTLDIDTIPNYLKYELPETATALLPLKEIEKAHILKVLAAVEGNKSKAAAILQIDRKTLRQKLL